MSTPTTSITLQNLRKQIARKFRDDLSGTASGGSTTTITMTGDIGHIPTNPSRLIGAEVSVISGTGAGQSRHITGHSYAAPTATLTVPTWTAPDATSTYEIHQLNGRGFSKAQYDDAINAAVESMVDRYETDYSDIPFGMELGSVVSEGIDRHEYPIPSNFKYLFDVQYLGVAPHEGTPAAMMDQYRSLGDATARTALWQTFQVHRTGNFGYVSVYLNKVGSPSGDLTLRVQTTSGGVPTGTTVTDGTVTVTGSTLDTKSRYVVFQFSPPVFLQSDTTYALVITSSTIDSNNYYRWGEDTDSGYIFGNAGTYNGVAYSALTSDFCFRIFSAVDTWITLRQKVGWDYIPLGSAVATGANTLYLPALAYDGTPVRLIGRAAISRPSAETSSLAIPVEYAEAYAIRHLIENNVGRALPDDYKSLFAAANGILATANHRRRLLPPNAVRLS